MKTTEGQIGGMLAYSNMYPATNHPKDVLVAREWDEFINQNLLDAFVDVVIREASFGV